MPTGPANQGYALPSITATVSAAAATVRAAAVGANLSSYELSAKSRVVVNQNNLPCCVSCALGAAMEIMNPNWPALAPLFHYYVARYDDGGANSDGFLFLDSALGTLTLKGICRGDLHDEPYTQAGAATKPAPPAYADGRSRALGRRGVRFRYLRSTGSSNVAWIREQLIQDRPVVIGIQLPMSYPNAFLNESFEWLDPDNSSRSVSGHCVLAVGYNDARQAVHIQDSHGEASFDKGSWWMGYRVIDSSVVQDVYGLIP